MLYCPKERIHDYPHYNLNFPKSYDDLGASVHSTDIATKKEPYRVGNALLLPTLYPPISRVFQLLLQRRKAFKKFLTFIRNDRWCFFLYKITWNTGQRFAFAPYPAFCEMTGSGGLEGSAREAFYGMRGAKNPDFNDASEQKLIDLFNSRKR